jgi:hypothetical protein
LYKINWLERKNKYAQRRSYVIFWVVNNLETKQISFEKLIFMAISRLETSRYSSNITLQNGLKLDKYAKVHKQAMLNNTHRNIHLQILVQIR